MAKLMYSEVGGFHNFPDSETPAGWVDAEPIRQAILAAKQMQSEPEAPHETVVPQDTPKRRPGRPPKNLVMENDLEHSTDDN